MSNINSQSMSITDINKQTQANLSKTFYNLKQMPNHLDRTVLNGKSYFQMKTPNPNWNYLIDLSGQVFDFDTRTSQHKLTQWKGITIPEAKTTQW